MKDTEGINYVDQKLYQIYEKKIGQILGKRILGS